MAVRLAVIRRDEWGAMTPRNVDPLELPVTHVVFTTEDEYSSCRTRETCMRHVRAIQKKCMEEGEDDLPYSFLVGNDGNVYEGRGWTSKPASNVKDDPNFKGRSTIDIGIIAGHKEVTPQSMDLVRAAFKTAEDFVQLSVKQRKIVENYNAAEEETPEVPEPQLHGDLDPKFVEYVQKHPDHFPVMSKMIAEKKNEESNQTIK